jgi:hypothetical protein
MLLMVELGRIKQHPLAALGARRLAPLEQRASPRRGQDDEMKPGFSKANGRTIANLSLRRCSRTVCDMEFRLFRPLVSNGGNLAQSTILQRSDPGTPSPRMYPDMGKRVVRRAPNAERGNNSILVESDRIKTFRFDLE